MQLYIFTNFAFRNKTQVVKKPQKNNANKNGFYC